MKWQNLLIDNLRDCSWLEVEAILGICSRTSELSQGNIMRFAPEVTACCMRINDDFMMMMIILILIVIKWSFRQGLGDNAGWTSTAFWWIEPWFLDCLGNAVNFYRTGHLRHGHVKTWNLNEQEILWVLGGSAWVGVLWRHSGAACVVAGWQNWTHEGRPHGLCMLWASRWHPNDWRGQHS